MTVVEQYSLTFDFGSGSVKAALISSDHRLIASANCAYATYYPKKGWAVQDLDTIWYSLKASVSQVVTSSGILPSQIKGIAISHTGSSIVFVDRDGGALCECVTWMDGRGREQAALLNARLGQELYTGKNVIAKLRWFLENEPDIVNRAYKLLDMQGYLLHRLTGNYVYEFTGARTTRLFDVVGGRWDDDKFRVSGFPRRLVPERVVRSADLVGRLRQDAAVSLGLAAGTPIFGGCCDHATAVLGTACTHPGDAHIYVGTSAWLSVTAAEYEDCPTIRSSPVPGQWYHFQESDSGGACIDFLWKLFYQKEMAENAEFGTIIGDECSDPASYRDLLFLPFLTGASAPISDVSVRASLLNLEAGTTRGQIARAVMDGIGFNLRWLKEFYSEGHGWNINCLRGIGGGMLIPATVQTIADVLGDPITTMKDPRFAGNIGLAACVEVGLREHSEGYGILERMNVFDKTYYPREEYRERYDRLYDIYKSAFRSLSDIYHRLNIEKED